MLRDELVLVHGAEDVTAGDGLILTPTFSGRTEGEKATGYVY